MGSRSADLVITGATVHTVDAAGSRAEAVAVSGGKIAAVGRTDDIKELIGSSTQVFDLPGRLVIPGFQDSHVHPPSSGIDRLRCSLEDIVDRGEVRATIAAYAESHPEEPWIV